MKVEALARRWGFSLHGAIWHAKNCDLLPPMVADNMIREIPDQDHEWSAEFETGVGVEEPDEDRETHREISPIIDGLLAKLVEEAASTGVISESRGREIATWK